jgi:hypothetical protein
MDLQAIMDLAPQLPRLSSSLLLTGRRPVSVSLW